VSNYVKYAKKINLKRAWQQQGVFCIDFCIMVCGWLLSAYVTRCYFRPSSLNLIVVSIRHSQTPANRTPAHDFGHHKRVKVYFKLIE